jgi:hypothetical protein
VEKIINEQQAMVVNATGDGRGWRTTRGWERSTANFSKTDKGVILSVDSRTSSQKALYHIQGNQLIGISEAGGGYGTIIGTMNRIQ